MKRRNIWKGVETDLFHDIEQEYWEWLLYQIGIPATPIIDIPEKTHYKLVTHLFNTPYKWKLSRDKNRAEDGIELRHMYLHENGYYNYDFPEAECTMLEFLIGVAARVDDIMATAEDDELASWFWLFIFNLELDMITDDIFDLEVDEVDRILSRFMRRTFSKKGKGGLFPMEYTENDQRYVEIWYQLNEYLTHYYDVM